jgi:hypothetical protein
MVITSQAMPPKNSTPTAAQGSGEDQIPGSESGDGKEGVRSGERAGAGTGDCKGELPDDRPGSMIDVVGVKAGRVAEGVEAGGIGVAVGDSAVGVGSTMVGVAATGGAVAVGRAVAVGGRGVGIGVAGTGVGVTGDTGDWNHAPVAGIPLSGAMDRGAKDSAAIRNSSKSCTAGPCLERNGLSHESRRLMWSA